MRFSIGGVFAKCPACKADDFYPALALTNGRRGVYICIACENEIIYSELRSQISKEMRRAEMPAPDKA